MSGNSSGPRSNRSRKLSRLLHADLAATDPQKACRSPGQSAEAQAHLGAVEARQVMVSRNPHRSRLAVAAVVERNVRIRPPAWCSPPRALSPRSRAARAHRQRRAPRSRRRRPGPCRSSRGARAELRGYPPLCLGTAGRGSDADRLRARDAARAEAAPNHRPSPFPRRPPNRRHRRIAPRDRRVRPKALRARRSLEETSECWESGASSP